MHPEDRAAACRDLDTAAAAPGAVLRQRCRLLLDDGRERVVELVGRMEERGGGGVMVGMVRDVTDEEARARLQIERDAMARAAQARMDFLSRLSHELRTPLNAVLGFAQLLLLDPLPPVQRDRVQTIEAAGRRLLALIEDVLDLTRLDEGAVQLVLEPVELGDAVRAGAALVEPARRAAGVALRLRLDDGAVHAMADAQRLRQVLVALLTNACHYNRPGGEIDVSVRRTDGDAATVEVSDTGYGMTPQELAVVFQPLAHAGRASGTEGAGLGLAISKLLMTRMGGQIRVTSSPAGSVFTLQLKASPPAAPAGMAPGDVPVDALDDPAVDLAERSGGVP
jgi:signal transduction histidine kinase